MEEFTDNQNNNSFENPAPQRPAGLSVACVLSFINAGFQVLINLFWSLFYSTIQLVCRDGQYMETMKKFMSGADYKDMEMAMQAQLAISRENYFITMLLYIGSFIGVLFMWKLQKRGFHIYAISQILILIAMAVFVTSVNGTPILGSVIMTALWIGIYFIYYRKTMQ